MNKNHQLNISLSLNTTSNKCILSESSFDHLEHTILHKYDILIRVNLSKQSDLKYYNKEHNTLPQC